MIQQDGTNPTEAPEPSSITLGQLSTMVGFRLRKTQNRLTSIFVQTLAPFDLRPGTFSCLSIISSNPGISQIALAQTVGLDKTKIMQIIDDLEARGLAERVRSPVDRRCHALRLTAEGENLTGKLFDMVKSAEQTALRGLSDVERKALMSSLDKILATVS